MAAYRRSIFLINKPFQLRFAFYVCSWIFGLSICYPLIIYNLFDYFIRYMAADPNGPGINTLNQMRHDMLFLLFLLEVVFVSFIFILSIFMSHKIAGPLYKLTKYFREAKDGKLQPNLNFRKRDHFQELAREYNEMIVGIQAQTSKKTEAVSRSIPVLERALAHADQEGRREIEQALSALRAARDHV